jgi:rhomboid protease GluP
MIMIVLAFGVEVLTGAWANPALLSRGANLPMAILRETDQYWRLLTSMFLHGDGTPVGGLMHVGVNLFSLWQLGSLYELMFGRRRFVSIYFIAGLAASVTSALHMPLGGSSVGASGAVLGILGAMISSILTSPRFRREPRARSLVAQCVFWALLNTVATSNIAGIDNAAHIGGLLAGLLLGGLLPHPQPPPQSPGSVVVDVRHDE